MEEKQNDLFTLGILVGILLLFAVTDLLTRAGVINVDYAKAREMPVYETGSLMDGTFFDAYENYAKGQFYNAEKWSLVVRKMQYFFGKREYDGVCLGKQNTFFERHLTEEYAKRPAEESLKYLDTLVREHGATVMLIPTSDEIWRDRLPFYADVFDQKAYLENVKARIGDAYVDVYSVLAEHAGEKIYYRTDPHWTSLGAYYGYETWFAHSGERLKYYYDVKYKDVITDTYVGPLAKKSGFEAMREQIYVYEETTTKPVEITYDGVRQMGGYYRPEYFDAENQYGCFLGDDFGFARIDTKVSQTKSLFVIGDSYANCMIPLIAPHYKTVYFVQPSKYPGNLNTLLNAFASDGKTDVLVLESVTGLLDEFR